MPADAVATATAAAGPSDNTAAAPTCPAVAVPGVTAAEGAPDCDIGMPAVAAGAAGFVLAMVSSTASGSVAVLKAAGWGKPGCVPCTPVDAPLEALPVPACRRRGTRQVLRTELQLQV